ncbi:MAG TPA: peptide chain release factor N(5)-glutamine methyltransferase [Xanthobacteraceae bacterium]|nr:peptide chain release factor N(5)-glutamine methyltransferase [Xanthobacteraceae bacterium]
MPAAAETAAGAHHDVRTVAAVRREWAKKFRTCGIDSADLDARILVGCALRLDRAALAGADSRELNRDEEAAIAALAERRLKHEPVARIVGRKEFWSLPLLVDASTLVPRPETETVVEAALAAIDAGGPRARPLRIADLGTGSGAILLALLSELPNASGVGTDVSVPALSTARNNARGLGLERAKFLACDIAAALRGPFDVIVSNPPYIASPAIAALAPEVRDYDPRGALDGGTDGLDFYRYIAAAAPPLLAPGGALIVELGAGQSQAVAALFAAGGLVLQPPYPDLSGVPRALVATRA